MVYEIQDDYLYWEVYPNPFTHQTTISFSLDKPSKADLVILDQKFSEVTVLLKDEKLKKGNYNYYWNRPGGGVTGALPTARIP